MTRTSWIAFCAAVALAAGCKKGDEPSDTSGGKTAQPPAQPDSPKPETRGPTAKETLEVWNKCIAAMNSQKVDAIVACYAEDAELTALDDTSEDKLDARTSAKIAEFYEKSHALSADEKAVPQVTIAGPGWIAAMVVGTATTSGKKVSALYAQLVWLDKNKRIQRDLRLIDQATLAHQTGASRSPNAPAAEKLRDEPIVVVADPGSADSADTRIQIVENLQEALASKSVDSIAAHLADDVVLRYVPHAKPITGQADYVKNLKTMAKMFSAMERKRLGAMGAGDWVVAHSVVTATPASDLPGAKGSAGKPVTTHQIELYRFDGSAIKEHWVFENSAQWGLQLAAGDEAAEP